jgi:protein-S-isoprenylcysteine O-methyltransferase Ste14
MAAKQTVLTIIVAAVAIFMGWKFAPVAWTPLHILGLCLILVGFPLWTVARFQLGNSFTVTAQARHLVTHGLYSKIRNPIYVFGSLFIAGLILMLGPPPGLAVFLVVIPLQLWRSGKEARILEAAFGDEYRRYRAGTWF